MPSTRQIARCLLLLTLLGAARTVSAAEVFIQLPADAQGLNGQLRDASLSVQTAEEDGVTAQDLVGAARADYARMVGALYEVGRYGGVVSVKVDGREVADISPLARPQQVRQIVIQVQPGPLFRFGSTRIAPLAPETELPEGFRPNAPAYSAVVGEAVNASTDTWRNRGHAKVAIADQRINANHRNARLSADVTLAPGPRLTFGNLVVTREGAVRSERIRAIAGLPTGKVYSPEEVRQASRRLRRTGAFSSVVLEDADRIGPGNTLDINATLADAKPRRFGFGAEISSFEGLTLSGFWLHRNLLGGAERLRVEGEVGGIGGDSGGLNFVFSTRFDRPATFNPDTDFFLNARAQELDEPDFRERSIRVGGGFLHRFSDELTGEIGVAYQFSDINDDLGSRTLEHFLLPGSLIYDTRDEELNAKKGVYAKLDLTPFVGLDNDSLGARVYFDARQYLTFGSNDGLTFATRAQIASINGAGLGEVPPDMLFYSGGAGTVRGQSYKSLAVNLGPGRRIGGRSFAALSAELRARVRDKWSVVGFADAGFVGADSWFDNGDSHYGAGFGVRYDTGLGPIRVDVATPLGSNAGENFELYIGIGQAF